MKKSRPPSPHDWRSRIIVAAFTILALQPLVRAADASPEELGNLWKASVSAESGGNYDEAVTQTIAFQQKGGDKFLANLRLGWLASLKTDYKRASEFYGAAIRLQPTSLNALLGLLISSQAQGDSKTASKVADSIIKAEPSNYRALTMLADISYKAGDFRKAHSLYRRVLVYYPEDTLALSGAAWGALKLNERVEAATLFTKLVSISPDYPYAQEGYGYAVPKKAAPPAAARPTANPRRP